MCSDVGPVIWKAACLEQTSSQWLEFAHENTQLQLMMQRLSLRKNDLMTATRRLLDGLEGTLEERSWKEGIAQVADNIRMLDLAGTGVIEELTQLNQQLYEQQLTAYQQQQQQQQAAAYGHGGAATSPARAPYAAQYYLNQQQQQWQQGYSGHSLDAQLLASAQMDHGAVNGAAAGLPNLLQMMQQGAHQPHQQQQGQEHAIDGTCTAAAAADVVSPGGSYQAAKGNLGAATSAAAGAEGGILQFGSLPDILPGDQQQQWVGPASVTPRSSVSGYPISPEVVTTPPAESYRSNPSSQQQAPEQAHVGSTGYSAGRGYSSGGTTSSAAAASTGQQPQAAVSWAAATAAAAAASAEGKSSAHDSPNRPSPMGGLSFSGLSSTPGGSGPAAGASPYQQMLMMQPPLTPPGNSTGRTTGLDGAVLGNTTPEAAPGYGGVGTGAPGSLGGMRPPTPGSTPGDVGGGAEVGEARGGGGLAAAIMPSPQDLLAYISSKQMAEDEEEQEQSEDEGAEGDFDFTVVESKQRRRRGEGARKGGKAGGAGGGGGKGVGGAKGAAGAGGGGGKGGGQAGKQQQGGGRGKGGAGRQQGAKGNSQGGGSNAGSMSNRFASLLGS